MLQSFEGLKMSFDEDSVARMAVKLKYLKLRSKEELDAEEHANYALIYQVVGGVVRKLKEFGA